jgi:hypothetical protein
MIWWVPEPIFVGSYSIEQMLAGSVPADVGNVHSVEGLKVPSESELKLTVPVGVDGVASVSMTVAVHFVGCETTTAEPQSTDTVVACGSAANACEHITSAKPTARAGTARGTPRPPSRPGGHSPSCTTLPPSMTVIVNPRLRGRRRQRVTEAWSGSISDRGEGSSEPLPGPNVPISDLAQRDLLLLRQDVTSSEAQLRKGRTIRARQRNQP